VEGGFASFDEKNLWEKINFPVFIVTKESAEKLRRFMNMERVQVPRLGLQNVTIFENEDEEDENDEL
jgi:hypothetical protein